MSKTSYLLALALFHDQQKKNQILCLWMFNIQCFLSGEMFGMKFRDRELPAPPLENSVESTKKTSVETTRKTLLETRTSKTETVKKVQAASPQFPRPNGRLSSRLEVWQRTKRFLYIIYFFRCLGSPGINQWTGKLLKRWSKKVKGLLWTLSLSSLFQLARMDAFWCETASMVEWTALSPSPSSTTTRSSTSASGWDQMARWGQM